MSYSRRQYLNFVEAQDFDTTLQQHVRAFEHLSGVHLRPPLRLCLEPS